MRPNAEKERASCKRHYAANKPAYLARNRRRLQAFRVIIAEAKSGGCIEPQCRGRQYHPYQLDFDHVRGVKKFNIGNGQAYSEKTLREEIAKCDVVCASCHRLRTFLRNHS